MISGYLDMIPTSRGLLSISEYLAFFTSCFLVVYAPYASAGNTGSSLSAIDNLALIDVGSSSPAAANADDASLSSQTDNLIPANADPTNNITCVGDKYDLDLPISAGFNPNTVSMQQLCAKTQFGGGPPGQHVGGWCQWGRYSNQVVFDLSAAAQINPVLANPRIMLGCSYRCFCNYNLGPNAAQPRAVPNTNVWESDQTYELQVEIVDDFDVGWTTNLGSAEPGSTVDAPQISHKGTAGTSDVQVYEVQTLSQLAYTEDKFNTHPRFTYSSMNAENEIECHGTLPRFPFPSPYRVSDFSTLQELCAVQFSGGNSGANAGGYCHRSDLPGGGVSKTVFFSDELTPRHDWTFNGPNFFFAAAIRTYCWPLCACNGVPQKKGPAADVFNSVLWNIVAGQSFAQHGDGSVTLGATDSQQGEMQILPPQPPSNRLSPTPPAGTCGPDGKQFCPATWPTDLLGPIPRAPPNATLIVADANPPASSRNFTTCGQYCSAPSDCGPGDAEDDCFCAIPSAQDAKTLGLDPVAPVSVCLVLALAITGISGRDDSSSRYLDGRGEPYQCPCNVTYISNECCGKRDGMVWVE